VEELKNKVAAVCKTRPSKFQLRKGTQTLKEHCTLLYYNITAGTSLDVEVHDPDTQMQIYLQLEIG